MTSQKEDKTVQLIALSFWDVSVYDKGNSGLSASIPKANMVDINKGVQYRGVFKLLI